MADAGRLFRIDPAAVPIIPDLLLAEIPLGGDDDLIGHLFGATPGMLQDPGKPGGVGDDPQRIDQVFAPQTFGRKGMEVHFLSAFPGL